LPSKIIEDFWIFDFPKRSGEKQVSEFFGVKTFKDITIEFKDNIEKHKSIEPFNNWFHDIKPYILTHRINSLSKETIEKNTVSNLKSVSVNLVSKLEYSINGGEFKQLLPNEFINKNKQEYYICGASDLTLEGLKGIPAFCEAFAEILCVLFEVNESKDDFRSVFKDQSDLKDTKYLIRTKMLNDKFEEACLLLGLSLKEMEFWKAVAEVKGIEWPESISGSEVLKKAVLGKFNYNLTSAYQSVIFETFHNQQSFDFIKDICNSQSITLSEISLQLKDFQGLFYWHKEKFNHTALDVELLWNKAWWLKLSTATEMEQRDFETKRKVFYRDIDTIISDLVVEYSYDIVVKYEESIIEKLCSAYEIIIDKEKLVDIEIENKYQEVINEYNIDINECPIEIQSLLYFPNHEEIIKAELEKLVSKDQKERDLPDEKVNKDKVNLIPTSLLKGTFSSTRAYHPLGNKNNGVHTGKSDRQKKKAGRRAEKLVKEKLIEMYPDGEICWISGNSDDNRIKLDDSKGYDIRYKVHKADVVWKYLEVKSVSGNSFIISSNEVNVGITNKENYHLALVADLDIYLIEDFFLDEERVAEFNSFKKSSSIRPLDYEVQFIFKEN